MSVGAVSTIVVCAVGEGNVLVGGQPVGCGTDAGGAAEYLQLRQAYVIDPASASFFEGSVAPFDYGSAAGFFGGAFVVVVGTWLLAHGCGVILDFVKRG